MISAEQWLTRLRLTTWERRAYALIALAAVAAYATCLVGDFVFDDRHSVSENLALRSLGNVPTFFSDARTFSSLNILMYRPVLLTSYALNAAIAGMEPWIFKLTNLGIHIGCCILTMQIARGLRVSAVGALFGALLFAVHPLASEAINTISGRSNLLMVLGLLLAIRCHMAAMAGNRWAPLGTAGAALIACGSKEVGVILPILLVIQEGLRVVGGERLVLRQMLLRVVPAVAVVVAYLLARQHVVQLTTFSVNAMHGGSDIRTGWGRDMSTQLATMAVLLPSALKDCLLPLHLTMDPPIPYTSNWLDPKVIAGVLFLIAVTVAGLHAPRRRPTLFLATCLAWGTVAPWVIKPLNHPYLEHRMYGAIAALSMVVGLVVGRLTRQDLGRVAVVTRWSGALVLLVFAILAGQRSLDFRSEAWLWEQEHRRNPESILALAGIADGHMRAGRFEKARPVLKQLLEIYPGHVMARRNLAQAELKLGADGDVEAAIAHTRYLIKGAPRNPIYQLLLSHALLAKARRTRVAGDFDAAVAAALRCLEIAEPKGLVYITAAQVRAEQGRPEVGVKLLDQSVGRGLDHWSVLIYRAELLCRLERKDEALRDLIRAQQQDPFAPQVLQAMQRFQRGELGVARPGR